jgi:CheY-like chemotaxis protein
MSVPKNIYTHTRILLVDDNSNGLKARKTVLEEHGYRITTANGGEDALAQFSPQKFDLVITGRRMARMDGIELISRLRAAAANMPIILISGYANTLGLNEQNTGADAVIQKSANEVVHLLRAVARLVRSRTPRKTASSETRAKAKRKAAN